jgi:hypothetical protein
MAAHYLYNKQGKILALFRRGLLMMMVKIFFNICLLGMEFTESEKNGTNPIVWS